MEISRGRLYRRWVLFCTVGELVGFGGIPVLGAALVLWLTTGLEPGLRSLLLYAVAVVAGAGEGAVLAWFQLRVLNAWLTRTQARHWILATAGAAAFAWALGMLAPTLDEFVGIPASVQIAMWVPSGLLILLSIGAAQAWVLRQVVENPRRWLIANVIGWLAGLPWTFVLPALLPETAPVVVWIVTFVIAGVLMGLTVGLVTGVALLQLKPISPGSLTGFGASHLA